MKEIESERVLRVIRIMMDIQKKPCSIYVLAENYGVCARTVLRDIRIIKKLGFEVDNLAKIGPGRYKLKEKVFA